MAAGASGDLTGTYTLGVAETAEDVAADTGTAATVAVGGTVTGEIESPDDRDWYAVTLEAGKTYRFDLVGGANQSGHTLWDPHLWGLHDATGALIDGTTGSDVGTTGGSNGGPGRNSRLNFTADTSSASIFDHGIEMMQLDPFRQFGPFFFTQTDHIELLHNHPSQLWPAAYWEATYHACALR